MTLLFDGSWPGYLSALFVAHQLRPPPDAILSEKPPQCDFFEEFSAVESDDVKARRLLNGIREKLPETALSNVEAMYRCGDDSEAAIRAFRYLRLGWKWHKNLDSHLEHPDVMAATMISKRVYGEVHRMAGLLRFASTKQGVYYAAMRTDHDILDMVADHFANRLRDMRWAIHDVPRGRAAMFDGNGVTYAEVSHAQVEKDEMEIFISSLWKAFHTAIAIKERTNPRCQAQHMPRRYWAYLLEMQGENMPVKWQE